jgi:hypothetical protein
MSRSPIGEACVSGTFLQHRTPYTGRTTRFLTSLEPRLLVADTQLPFLDRQRLGEILFEEPNQRARSNG